MLELNDDLLLRVNNIAIKAGSKIMQFYLEDTDINDDNILDVYLGSPSFQKSKLFRQK